MPSRRTYQRRAQAAAAAGNSTLASNYRGMARILQRIARNRARAQARNTATGRAANFSSNNYGGNYPAVMSNILRATAQNPTGNNTAGIVRGAASAGRNTGS